MHIVFLTNEYPKGNEAHGGIGTFVQNLAQKLIVKGIQVSVVGIYNSQTEIENDKGVLIHRIQQSKAKFGMFLFNSFRIRKKLKEINKKNHIDIVEGAELSFAFLPKITTYKKVIRMHGGHHFFSITLGKNTAFWRSFQEKKSFKKVDALVAVSDYVGTTTSKLLNLKKSFKTIYNFIDLERFNPTGEVSIAKNSIVFIGTICEKKGVKELVDAFPLIKEQLPQAKLKLIGRDWSSSNIPSYVEFLKARIEKKYRNSIHFLGTVPQEQIPPLIESAHICVYPSHMESFGITVIEAMAMQKPIVYSNIPPFKEIIKNNYSGLKCNPFDSKDIAEKIISLISDEGKSESLSKNAKSDVNVKFDTDRIVNQNIKFYSELIK